MSNGSAASATDATDRLDKLAEAIASGKGRGAHKHGHHHATNNNPNTGLLNNISKMLDTTSSDLVTARRGGTSLGDIAKQKGVSADSVL